MTHSDHAATPGPKGRTDSTRPPRIHRGGQGKPYPSAPTPTAASRRSTRRASTPTRPDTASPAPTPATVWACGATPIDPDARWPTPIVTKIVTSFSEPGDRVVVLPWPTPLPRPPHARGCADRLTDRAPQTDPDDQLATVLTTIEDLDRTVRLLRVQADSIAHRPASPPFWADLLDGPNNPHTPEPDPPPSDEPGPTSARFDLAARDTELIITSLRPEHSADRTSDHVALLAARLLRVGGILAVLTHSDWSRDELVDPTGPIVACAQNADLLYLQHIVALHTPIHRGQFLREPPSAQAPTRHPAPVRGLPAPHHRISSDVLVFAQPHDHEPPPPATIAGFETADRR
ncbi:MAG: hypothetical protein ACRDUW_15420 [Pseudonocardiaceae bacterium]